jgi:hypothetical protein
LRFGFVRLSEFSGFTFSLCCPLLTYEVSSLFFCRLLAQLSM